MIKTNSIQSILVRGNSARIIDIECSITNGLPSITIIGLGNKIISEAKERIRSAFLVSKIPFPKKRITLNLAPADIPKESTSFDMAMAVSILTANNQLSKIPEKDCIFIGEISLDGTIRATRGIIGQILAGKQCGIKMFYVPLPSLMQAQLVPGITLVAIHNLKDLYQKLTQTSSASPPLNVPLSSVTKVYDADPFMDIVGQEAAKRALVIAAA